MPVARREKNGRVGISPLQRMPVRTMRVELDGDYAGFAVTMRSNPPLRVFSEMQGQPDFEKLRELVGSLVVDWNLTDDDGQSIRVGDFDSISIELFGIIISRYLNSITGAAAVPKA